MTDEAQKSVTKKLNPREIVAIVLGIYAIAVCIANRDKVKLDLIAGTWHMPLIILAAGCLLVGAGLGYLAAGRKPSKD